MRKHLYYLLVFLLGFCGTVLCQNTNTTGNLATSTPWIGATVTATLNNPGGGKVVYATTGLPVPLVVTGTADASGNFSLIVADGQKILPAGTTWIYTFCPAATISVPCSQTNPIPVTGASQSIQSFISLTEPSVTPKASVLAAAYSDAQISPLTAGTCYVNYSGATPVQRCYNPLTGLFVNITGSAVPANPQLYYQANNSGVFGTFGISHISADNSEQSQYPFRRYATNQSILQPGFGSDYYTHGDTCYYNNFLLATANEAHSCVYAPISFFSSGWNSGPGNNGNFGWYVSKGYNHDIVDFSAGISQGMSGSFYCNKVGDCGHLYYNTWYKGGWIDDSGEGGNGANFTGGEANGYWSGTSAVAGTGVSSVSMQGGATGDPQSQPQTQAFLANLSTPSWTGHITGTAADFQLTVDTATVPSQWCTLNSAVNIGAPNPPNGVPSLTVGCTLQGTTTSLTTGSAIAACSDHYAPVNITTITAPAAGAQTITATWIYGAPAGCEIYQGGTHGILDLVADRNSSMITSYMIPGAQDSTHLSYRYYTFDTLEGIPSKAHNFGSSIGSVSLSRVGNLVTATGSITPTYANTIVQISGASDSSFNGTFATGNLTTANTITWSQTLANSTATGATMATGGAVDNGSNAGGGSAHVYPAAMISSVGTTTTIVNGVSQLTWNGTANLWPNDMVLHLGDSLQNPHHPSSKFNQIRAEGNIYTPPSTKGNTWANIAYGGSGASGPFFFGQTIFNTQGWGTYQYGGGGGHLIAPTAQRILGAHSVIRVIDAPLHGGIVEQINPNVPGSAGFPMTYFYNHLGVDGINRHYYQWDGVGYSWRDQVVTPSGKNAGVVYDANGIHFNLNNGGTQTLDLNGNKICTLDPGLSNCNLGYLLKFAAIPFAFANSTVYNLGEAEMITTGAVSYKAPAGCKANNITFTEFVATGAPPSSEAVDVQFLVNGTFAGENFANWSGTSQNQLSINPGFHVINAGDALSISIHTPAWATPPTGTLVFAATLDCRY